MGRVASMSDPRTPSQKQGDNYLSADDFAKWPWQRCRAVREPEVHTPNWHGRCELKKNHRGDHALERGFDIPRWSTEWTA
jgi:hypothetical protein